jgi:Rad3-related DNA helicase
MELLEFIIILVIIGAVACIVYYYLRGSSGKVSLTRPVESRVDEYLDRKFESMVQEWELVTQPKLQRFVEQRENELGQDEARLKEIREFESEMQGSLEKLEARLDAVEKEFAKKGRS